MSLALATTVASFATITVGHATWSLAWMAVAKSDILKKFNHKWDRSFSS